MVATEKGIVPHLMRMLDFDSRIRPNDGVCFVLEALSLREDLSKDQLQQITAHMRELLKTQWSPQRSVDDGYLSWGALVLQNYPSPENEELALRLLERPTSDHDFILMRVNAARSLAKIGSAKGLPTAEKAAEEMKRKYGGRADFWIGKMDEALAGYRRRLGKGGT